MCQECTDPRKKFNPYDLSAIAHARNRHDATKSPPAVSKHPYEPEHFSSAYDLSIRPGEKGSSTR